METREVSPRHMIVMAAFAVALLTGCAVVDVPPDRIFAYQASAPGTAMVVIERNTSTFFGGGVPAEVIIDGGSAAAQLWANEKVTLHIPAGEHQMGVSPRFTFLGPQFTLGCQRPHRFEAGKTYYLTLANDEAIGQWCIMERWWPR